MPRKGRVPRRSSRPSSDITRTVFRAYLSQTRTTSGLTIAKLDLLLSALGDRAVDIGSEFEFFRVSQLRAFSFTDALAAGPSATQTVGAAVMHGLAFDNGPGTATTAATMILEIAQFKQMRAANGFREAHINVEHKDLFPNSALKWYQTQSTGSVDATERSAGSITYFLQINPGATLAPGVSQHLFLDGVIEFHTPVDFQLSAKRVIVPRSLLDDPMVKRELARLESAVEDAQATKGASGPK